MRKHDFHHLQIIPIIIFFLLGLGIILFFGSQGFLRSLTYGNFAAGQVADRDLVVDHDIYYEDLQASALRLLAQRALVKPVFRLHEEISRRILTRYDQLFTLLSGFYVNKKNLSSAFLELQSSMPGILTEKVLEKLLKKQELPAILEEARSLLVAGVNQGILGAAVTQDLSKGLEIIRIQEDKIQRQLWEPDQLLRLPGLLPGWDRFVQSKNLRSDFQEAVYILFLSSTEENVFFDSGETERNLLRLDLETPPVRRQISQGEWLVRKDYVISSEAMVKVQALVDHYGALTLNRTVGAIFFLVALGIMGLLLFKSFKLERIEKTLLWTFGGFWLAHLLIITLVISPVGEASGFWYALVPTSLIIILATLLTSERVGLFLALMITLPILLIAPQKGGVFLAEFFAALAIPFIMRKVEKRMDLIKAGLWLAPIQTLFFVLAGLLHEQENRLGLGGILGAGINGFLSSILALGLLPILEHFLNTPSQFRLAELADLNTPILKRMLALAPGTYAHSVNTAQLSEQAARAIGADPYLCRVGALYHDLGKIDQAEYFIENQRGYNKHDSLKASVSVTLLKSHVKLGLEKARELKLPQKVLDIIGQHHGSGLITFFYSKAVNERGEDKVSKDDFKYPGPNPSSKESAIVMLADTVEAASRTLNRPTVSQVDTFVYDLIIKRYHEGLLNNSGLSFSDLEKIRGIFVQVLAGQFHSRIEYPLLKEGTHE